MKFSHEIRYDAAPDAVFAMLSDPAFREAVSAAQQVVSADVVITPAGNGFTMVNKQVQNTAGLPAIAKKIVGDTTDVVVTEKWASATSGTVEIVAPGKPTQASGMVRLAPGAGGRGTVETVQLEIKVKVPLIGGKLEGLMADNVTKGLDVEQGVGADWLKET